MKNLKKILPLLSVLTLASCGGSGSSSSDKQNGPPEREEQIENIEGNFKAILRPYNFTVSGWVPSGMTDIKVVGDQVEITSWLDDSSDVIHMQHIHFGTSCPEAIHDSNGDGFVDFNESLRVSGRIFLPLDSDLTSHNLSDVFPKGNFTYYQKASMSEIVANVKSGFNLEGKVIIVMGAAANRNLPRSVSTIYGQTRELSMPIACGVIHRQSKVTEN